MTTRRWSDVAAAVVAALVIVGLVFALRPQATPIASVNPTTVQGSRQLAPTRTEPTVLFIGDSYTAGNNLAELSPSCVAAVAMNWLCHLSAVPGTGYISGGPANRFTVDPYIGTSTSFSERIARLATVYQPDIVVLDGGRNDQFPPKDDVFKQMVATIADVRQTWPAATLVFVRPRFLARPDDDLGFDDRFMSRLQADPVAQGMIVIDPISRFTDENVSGMLSPDGIHPNQQGEQALASALVKSLLSHGFAGRK